MTPPLVLDWLREGRLSLPLPGSGSTAQRWRRLTELTAIDVVAGRLAEAHADAIAIMAELGGLAADQNGLWGVWAAEAPDAVVAARRAGDESVLDGTKAWCSGAGLCTHALVTARLPDGRGGLFAVDLRNAAVQPMPSAWRNAGMAESDTRAVRFADAPAVLIGKPDDYLTRPGFWFGAIGVAACWLGGARAVAASLYRSAAKDSADGHLLAHLGAVDAALTAAESSLAAAAERVDDDPDNLSGSAELTARRVRAVVENTVDVVLARTDRALGPGPLCTDDRHARSVADLTVYVRQSHAERDLASLGQLVAGQHAGG
jgi:alkylation response protein AidB-like acyl-CoA dehydrogenase